MTARAHTSSTGTDPADGANLAHPPRQISVSFSEPPLATGSAMVAQGPAGRVPLSATAKGNSVVAPWPDDATAGTYRVTYRVVAADGHPITGEFGFRVAGRPSPPSRAAASPTPAATASAAPAQPAESSGPPAWLWLVVAVLIAAGAVIAVTRGRKPSD